MKSLAEARLKRARAVALVAEGKSYDEVAREAGYAHRGSAHRAVSRALDEREVQGVELLRQLEGERLDAMLAALWPRIETGDVAAIRTALAITDRRMRLFGFTGRRGVRRVVGEDGEGGVLVVPPPEGNPRAAT